MAMAGWLLLLLFLPLLFLDFPCNLVNAYDADFPSANISTSWKNNPSSEKGSVTLISDGSILRPILLVYNKSYPPFGLGFLTYNNSSFSTSNSFYLVVFVLADFGEDTNYGYEFEIQYTSSTHVLWSANRDKPVGENATLDFTAEGELVLKDADGTLVWSTTTNTSRSIHSAAHRMEITVGGNLMVLNGSNGVVWQSFDYPTDTWLSNQKIYRNSNQRLTARNSQSNLSTGIYYLSVDNVGVHAFLDSNLPKQYASLLEDTAFMGGLTLLYPDMEGVFVETVTFVQFAFNFTPTHFQYIVMEPNGHLFLYGVHRVDVLDFGFITYFVKSNLDLLSSISGDSCCYPKVCGHYGVCLDGGNCRCPAEYNGNLNYFKQFDRDVGCTEITLLSCEGGSNSHTFVELQNVTYFDFVPMLFDTTLEKCKETCSSNCSCKAAFFRYEENVSLGNCSLQSDELYSFKDTTTKHFDFKSYAFIKVQKVLDGKKHVSLVLVLVPSILGALILVTFVFGICYCYRRLKNTHNDNGKEGDDLLAEAVLTKFSFEELKSSTWNFQIKLGQGGFGAVFEGVLRDGTKVAVKCLDSVGQGYKEFLAEVNTIGKVNHFNLVKLIGYCTEKSKRLLVYEYMCNGSLDRWIFNPDNAKKFSWTVRHKIICDVAKGLEYLHEECRRNIIHFDIKPQNILLDGDFNAKISDFGLAKLVDRDQRLVLTRLKGTPGYVAPELFGGSNTSVKADVYSFGIVILETVCARKNLDSSESRPLINIVKTKVEEDRLYDLIDECNEDIQSHKEEAIRMIKIGIWCLQTHNKRPGMSMVVKALEGLIDMDLIIDHQFLTTSHIGIPIEVYPNVSDPPEGSILSGPR